MNTNSIALKLSHLKTHTLQEYYSVRNSSNKCKKKNVSYQRLTLDKIFY